MFGNWVVCWGFGSFLHVQRDLTNCPNMRSILDPVKLRSWTWQRVPNVRYSCLTGRMFVFLMPTTNQGLPLSLREVFSEERGVDGVGVSRSRSPTVKSSFQSPLMEWRHQSWCFPNVNYQTSGDVQMFKSSHIGQFEVVNIWTNMKKLVTSTTSLYIHIIIYIHIWLVVWNIFHILGIIIPTG